MIKKIPYNWVGIKENGILCQLEIPKKIRNDSKAFCNSKKGIKYRKLSTEFIKLFKQLKVIKKIKGR